MNFEILCYLIVSSATIASCQFGPSGIQGILEVHNTLKSKIARGLYTAKGLTKQKGANLVKYRWDPEIAKIAQKYAETCPAGHSNDQSLGENLYWTCSTAPFTGDLNKYGAEASKSWEDEFQEFGWKTNVFDMNLAQSGVGHATQMAWATTDTVGCGRHLCKDGNFYKVAVVCNYKPPGNWINQAIYIEGPPCSACPKGKKCEAATGLCY